MAENLNIGTRVDGTSAGTDQNNDPVIEKYCYKDTEEKCSTDGGLYQWSEAMGLASTCSGTTCSSQIGTGHHRGICPVGWHIPKPAEWNTLATILGGSIGAGQKMKFMENTSGFTALPVGYRSYEGGFLNRGSDAYFWEASEINDLNAEYRYLNFSEGYETLFVGYFYKTIGFSVRCFKN